MKVRVKLPSPGWLNLSRKDQGMKIETLTVNLPDGEFVELRPRDTQHVTLALHEARMDYPHWTSMLVVVVPTKEDKG
jgi:hypothetical protein